MAAGRCPHMLMLVALAVAAWATAASTAASAPETDTGCQEDESLRAELAAAHRRSAALEAEVSALRAAVVVSHVKQPEPEGPSGAMPVNAREDVVKTIARNEEASQKLAAAGPEAWRLPRLLSVSTSSSSSNASSTNGQVCHAEEHETHPQDAMIFLLMCILIGTALTQVKTYRRFSFLQETICLFILGLLFAVFIELLGGEEHTGVVGSSYGMWMRIKPHLLLFTMLPVLLTGDAMTIDTTVARSVASQCMYLAGPGVIINSLLLSLFLWLYLGSFYEGWQSFNLCLVQGSILAATDPVAVVSMLKELGAPPALTVQIAGESLLNDGTAIVFYTLAYDLLKGVTYDSAQIIIFLVKTVLCACGLGYVLGYVFVAWIRMAGDSVPHNSIKIQISLTLLVAYVSYILAEGILHISGVLCTVFASLVLADKMWPALSSREAIEHVWHTFEYVGNTVIFFLAGALTGHTIMTSTSIRGLDYLHLLLIYIVMMVVRGSVIFCSIPILRALANNDDRVSLSDTAVMTWGGLRGAVGLALAIQVSMEANDIEGLDGDDGKRVLFYTCGIAALTLVINASTCPMLMKWLDIGRTTNSKAALIKNIYHRLLEIAEKVHSQEDLVTKVLHDVLKDVCVSIEKGIHTSVHDRFSGAIRTSIESKSSDLGKDMFVTDHSLASGTALQESLDARMRAVEDVPVQVLKILSSMCPGLELDQKLPTLENMDEIREAAAEDGVSGDLLRLVHEVFLSFLRAQYWKLLDQHVFTAGSGQIELLFSSVEHAFTHAWFTLSDFRHVKTRLNLGELIEVEDEDAEMDFGEKLSASKTKNVVIESIRRLSRLSMSSRTSVHSVRDIRLPGRRVSLTSMKNLEKPSERGSERTRGSTSSEMSRHSNAPSVLGAVNSDVAKTEDEEEESQRRLQSCVEGVALSSPVDPPAFRDAYPSQTADDDEDAIQVVAQETAETAGSSQLIQSSSQGRISHADPPLPLDSSTDASRVKPGRKTKLVHPVRKTKLVRMESSMAFGEHLKNQLSSGASDKDKPWALRTVESITFQCSIISILVLNATFIVIEQSVREGNDNEVMWLVFEIIFLMAFTVEFIMKFRAIFCKYFMDVWNLFDFAILLLGFGSVVLDIFYLGVEGLEKEDADISSEARLIRLVKAMRLMRILRVFRLIHFYHRLLAMIERRHISVQIAERMKNVTVLAAFTQAHATSQAETVEFFEREGLAVTTEVARCIIESQVSMYEAILFCTEELAEVSHTVINGMSVLRESNAAMDHMTHYVEQISEKKILTEREANIVLGPLQDRMALFRVELRACELGLLREDAETGSPSMDFQSGARTSILGQIFSPTSTSNMAGMRMSMGDPVTPEPGRADSGLKGQAPDGAGSLSSSARASGQVQASRSTTSSPAGGSSSSPLRQATASAGTSSSANSLRAAASAGGGGQSRESRGNAWGESEDDADPASKDSSGEKGENILPSADEEDSRRPGTRN